jgi:hypothetical protein
MPTYKEIASMETSVGGLHICPDDSKDKIYIFEDEGSAFYIFDMIAKSLTKVAIQSVDTGYTDYSGDPVTIMPNDKFAYVNGGIYSVRTFTYSKSMDYVAQFQVYKLNPNNGNAKIILDSRNVLPTIDDFDEGSYHIYAVDFTSWGGRLFLSYRDWSETAEYDPHWYYGVLYSGRKNTWKTGFREAADTPTGADNRSVFLCKNESTILAVCQSLEGYTSSDKLRDGTKNWGVIDSDSSLVPAWRGCDGKFWRTSGDDLYYTENNFRSSGWTEYGAGTLETDPVIAQAPYGVTSEQKKLLLDTSNSGEELNAYFDLTLDATISPDNVDAIEGADISVTFNGIYVVLDYIDQAGTEYLEVWKRAPKISFPVKPRGLDMAGNELYATGDVCPFTSPFLLEVKADTLASGVACVIPGSGYLYPHAGAQDFVYLYGTIGPYSQCVIYSGYYGNAQAALTGLPSGSIITDLMTAPTYDPDDAQFTTISPSKLHSSDDGGETFSTHSNTTWAAKTLYRVLSAGGGEAGTFIGAYTGQDCAINITEDLSTYQARCSGLPNNVQITEIEGADYVED